MSGAERSLLELLAALPRPEFDVIVASPPGPLRDLVADLGVDHRRLPGTTGSFKLSPVGTPRAMAEMLRAGAALRGLARSCKADLVHANSIRSGLIAGVARKFGGPPVVVHARDAIESGVAATIVRRALSGSAAHVIAISHYVARTLEADANRLQVTVLHNPVDLRRFDPERIDRHVARAALGIAGEEPLLGVLAQITPWKGQDDSIRALAALRNDAADARLLLVGEVKFAQKGVRFDNPRYLAELCELAASLGVTDAVSFLGERQDIPEVLAALDLVLVPSWAEPFGRTVIEGMAMGRAVLATSVGGPPEVIEDGVDGLLLPPKSPDRWASAARDLLLDTGARTRLEQAARRTATRFDRNVYAERVASLYRSLSLDR